MKFITMMQSFVAAVVLAAGALVARNASATDFPHSCQSVPILFGASITNPCDTNVSSTSDAAFGSGNRGASDAVVYAELKNVHDFPDSAQIVALDSSMNAISGCKAVDNNATDGVSVYDQTGCQNGRWVIYSVQWHTH